MNDPEQTYCLICAFSGISKRASACRKVFLPHDHSFRAHLCPTHEDATPEQIRTAFLTMAVDAEIRKPLTE